MQRYAIDYKKFIIPREEIRRSIYLESNFIKICPGKSEFRRKDIDLNLNIGLSRTG